MHTRHVFKTQTIADLVTAAMRHDKQNRRSFPWRETADPYRILVSEYMLQQTQTERVVDKYGCFLKSFPTVRDLAAAARRAVLARWVGLGYNRRAIALHDASRVIVRDHGGIVPSDEAVLLSLPGVGPYTAAAVVVFAHNRPAVAIETNVRAAVAHHCMPNADGADDATVRRAAELVLAEALRRSVSPRDLYTALMDYGAHLKRIGAPASRPRRAPQKKFAGSVRQARGMIVRMLLNGDRVPAAGGRHLAKKTWTDAIDGLVRDGVIGKRGAEYVIRDDVPAT